jgi:LPS export ABC transporter protein LptC
VRLGLAVLLAVALFAGCTKIASPPSGEPSKLEMPQQEFYDATITFYQSDKLNGVLQAGRIRKFEKSATILLDSGVVMDFFNEQGQHTTKLWADSARTDENRKDMVAMGHVIAKSDSGETLHSEELRWDNRTRQIRSNTRVKLMTPTDTINGIGFVSDEHLKNWTVTQPTGTTTRELQKPAPRDSLQTGTDQDSSSRKDSAR